MMSEQIVAERYQLHDLIFEDGKDHYYSAFDTQTHTRVVTRIKILDIDPADNDTQEVPLATQRANSMRRELAVMERLKHPNLLEILDYGQDEATFYIVYKHFKFKRFADLLEHKFKPTLRQILTIIMEIADAMSHLHYIGIVHCSLSPDHIWIVDDRARVVDFGAANFQTHDNLTIGVPVYISPESARGADTAPARDIWSLGVILYEALTGVVPFDSDGTYNADDDINDLLLHIVNDPVPSITDHKTGLPPRLVALVHWMLEKDPQRRVRSMRKVASELETIIEGLGSQDDPIEGDVIHNRYHLQQEIGEGGFGQIFRGADLQTGETVAIKQLKDSRVDDESAIKRFRREADVLRRVNHPNIVKVLDTFERNNGHFIIMEYVPGGDLRQIMNSRKIPLEEALSILLELADALTRAHHLEIIHRDIKPDNVLIAEDGTPRLADFGLAYQESGTNITAAGNLVGTVAYLSPEAIRQNARSKSSDIWAFGVLMYELLTGKYPFQQGAINVLLKSLLEDPIPSLQNEETDLPDALIWLVDDILQRDVEQRVSSMRHIATELEDILQQVSQART